MKNLYSGYVVGTDTLDRVPADIDPQRFFDEYIAKRKPCIFEGHLADPEWKASDRWVDMKYLSAHAGDAELEVEPRDSTDDSFGKGRKVWPG